VTAGLAESNGSLLPVDEVTCGLTACRTGSALGPMLGNKYGRSLLYLSETGYKKAIKMTD